MKIKPTKKSNDRFDYFVRCEDKKRIPEIVYDKDGYTAKECFFAHESWGESLPCKEPELLSRALNGKEWHGLNVTHVAEDFVDRLCFAEEIKENYPEWVQKDIFGRAKQVAMRIVGFVPTFVKNSEDFTTMKV